MKSLLLKIETFTELVIFFNWRNLSNYINGYINQSRISEKYIPRDFKELILPRTVPK